MPVFRFAAGLCVSAAVLIPAEAGAQSATWAIDPGHSAARFSVRHMVISDVTGVFDGPTGTITFDPSNPTGLQVEATIDARTINTRNPDRDKDLRSALFFDTDRFPTITFKSRRVEAAGPNRLKVTGDLTMRGATHAVVLDVEGPTPAIKDIWGNTRIGAVAKTAIDRREFGLMYNRVLEGGGAVIGDQVSITIDLELTRNAAASKE